VPAAICLPFTGHVNRIARATGDGLALRLANHPLALQRYGTIPDSSVVGRFAPITRFADALELHGGAGAQ
jgi:hypothetical protein